MAILPFRLCLLAVVLIAFVVLFRHIPISDHSFINSRPAPLHRFGLAAGSSIFLINPSSNAQQFLSSQLESNALIKHDSEAIVEWITSRFQIHSSELILSSVHASQHNQIMHFHFALIYMNSIIDNAFIQVNVNIQSKQVVSFSSSVELEYNGNLDLTSSLVSKNEEDHLSISRCFWDIQCVEYNQLDRLPKSIFKWPIVSNHDFRLQFLNRNVAIHSILKAMKTLYFHLNIPFDNLENQVHSHLFIKNSSTLEYALSPVYPFHDQLNMTLGLLLNGADGDFLKTWKMQVRIDKHWYELHIDLTTYSIVQCVDWTADAAYRVFPTDPFISNRQLIIDPAHPYASPCGWHTDGKQHFFDTRGNNADVQKYSESSSKKWSNSYRPSSRQLNFDYALSLNKTPRKYIDASITSLFYWINYAHDFFYVYGFDEQSGNFQKVHFPEKHKDEINGKSGDPVIGFAQDTDDMNNAHFTTPPDGQSPILTSGLWDTTKPKRDGALEIDIILHEYTHGVSSRLTGGASNAGCLGFSQPGGLSEGWSDFFATILRMNASTQAKDAFEIAKFSNGGTGIRYFPYTVDWTLNPVLYSYMNKPGYHGVHALGEIWCEILIHVYWELVNNLGFQTDFFQSPLILSTFYGIHVIKNGAFSEFGNTLMMQLVIDGMKLQPCMPSFIDARNAILLADQVTFNGRHECLLWKGFSRRGLGFSATVDGMDGFDVPEHCC